MLPLDEFDEKALGTLEKHGVDPSSVTVAVRIDLDFKKKYVEAYLAIDAEKRVIYRLTPDRDEFDTFDMNVYSKPSVDNFPSSDRVVFTRDNGDGTTTDMTVAFASKRCTERLRIFIEVANRLLDGEEVKAEDDIFKQFRKYCPKCHLPYPPKADGVCPRCDKDSSIILKMLKYYKPYMWSCLVIFLGMCGCSFVNIITPQIQGRFLYDDVIAVDGAFHSEKWVIIAASVIFGLALFSTAIQIIQQTTQSIVCSKITATLKQDLFAKIQSLSLSYFNKVTPGTIIHRVNNDAPNIASFFNTQIPSLIFQTFCLIGISIFLFTMNWKLTTIIFLPVPVIIVMFKVLLPKIHRMYGRQWRANNAVSSMIGDSLDGIRVVKAFAKEADEANRFRKLSDKLYHTNLQTNLIWLTIFPVISLVIGLASKILWGVGGIMVMGEEMKYGEFVTYFGYVWQVFGPLQFYATFSDSFTNVINSCEHYFEIMDTTPDILEKPESIVPEKIDGRIEFDRVNFSYDINRPILKDMSFLIKPGEHIGLVGHTGAGKSTIANLITRMYDPVNGVITLDGMDMRDLSPEVVRKNIAIISQEIFIFHGTIADNIRYAKPDATMEEVIAAARAANAHDFIMIMPHGYDTMVGEGERSLSGGEQQRVSIARALLMDPTILILDEATAAMDTETERLIGKAIENIVEGRTTISIAHRLSTLKNCNRLYTIEDGRIAESGTHKELIAAKGIYYRLYLLQSEADRKIALGE